MIRDLDRGYGHGSEVLDRCLRIHQLRKIEAVAARRQKRQGRVIG